MPHLVQITDESNSETAKRCIAIYAFDDGAYLKPAPSSSPGLPLPIVSSHNSHTRHCDNQKWLHTSLTKLLKSPSIMFKYASAIQYLCLPPVQFQFSMVLPNTRQFLATGHNGRHQLRMPNDHTSLLSRGGRVQNNVTYVVNKCQLTGLCQLGSALYLHMWHKTDYIKNYKSICCF